MDPALWDVLEAGSSRDEVAVLLRVRPGAVLPPGVRPVARFGDVLTARIARRDIVAIHGHPAVVSLKAARELRPEPAVAVARRPTTEKRSRNPWSSTRTGPTGRGVVVGVVDWGLDVTHPNLRRADGGTRLLAIWDQRPRRRGSGPAPYGYGRVFRRAAIDRALGAADPFAALGYDPADADSDGTGTHGTHVVDIAAGAPRVGPGGVAPAAELVFVHLATERTGPRSIGNSVSLVEAIDFISRVAGDRPCVINLSLGSHAGPHDGTTLCEQALDAFVLERAGRAIVQSAGNYRQRPVHAAGTLQAGGRSVLEWLVAAGDDTTNELDVWYPGPDRLSARLVDGSGRTVARATPDRHGPLVHDGEVIGRFAHRTNDPNNGDNHIAFVVEPGGAAERWRVVLEPLRVRRAETRWHAWIERDELGPGTQSRLGARGPTGPPPAPTTGTIANGHHTIVVGAYDPRTRRPAPFSSEGPTRDGRPKPDLLAPGVGVIAARSAPLELDEGHPLLTRKTGTSMAAPHVTGAVALLYEAAGRPLSIGELRAALGVAVPAPPLDLPAAVARVRGAGPEPPALPAAPAAALFDAFTVPSRHLARFALPPLELVAAAGAAPGVPLEPGDLLVERALGEGDVGAVEVLAPAALAPAARPRPDRIVVRRQATRPTAWRFAPRARGPGLALTRRAPPAGRAATQGRDEAIGGFVDVPPVGKIEVGRRGLFLRVGPDLEYVAGLDRTEQVLASWVRTLVGDAYTPLLAEELRGALGLAISNLSGAAQAGEKLAAERGGFGTTTARTGLEVVRWLRDTRGLRLLLDDGRLRRLEHACAIELAWNEVYAQTGGAGEFGRSSASSIFPLTWRYAWVTRSLFTDIAWGLGPLVERLRVAMLAFEASPGPYGSREFDARNAAMQALWDELNKGADPLDAIRADAALRSHKGIAYVFPERIEARAAPGHQAPTPPPDGHAGRVRFIEVCLARYPDLARRAKERTDARARRQLLDRFTADFDALIAWSAGAREGDDALGASIAEANAPPFPSYLRVNPEGPALPSGAEVHAEVTVRADHWTSVWDYRYWWDLLRIDDQGATEQSLSRWTMFGRRLSRELGYTATDYERLRRELEVELGPPGVGPASIAGALAISRFVGTAIQDVFRAIFERPYEKSLVLPGPGLYLLRCVAGDPDRDGALLRVPSAAYQLLHVMDPRELSRRRAEAALEGLRAMALDEPMLAAAIDAGVLDGDELEGARAELEQARAVLRGDAASLYALQRANLERARDDARIGGAGTSDARRTREQIEQRLRELDRITAERSRRLAAVRGVPYRVIAVLVTDLGPTLTLMIEAVDEEVAAGRISVLVVDSTAKHSGFERRTASTRLSAIRAALRALLENKVTGYGRGSCTILVPADGVTGVGAHDRDTFRVDLDSASLLTEMIEGGALIISALALLAAPFTGGASLAILIPVGVIGAIPSAYRLVKRNEEGTFAWDLETALDLVNLASAFFGLGQTGSGALRLTRLARVFQIAGHGGDGLGIVLGKVELLEQLEAIAQDGALLPGQRRLAMAMAVANTLLADGVMVGHALAMRTYGQMLRERMDPARYPLAPAVLLEGGGLPPVRERSLPGHLEPVSAALKAQARALAGRDVAVLRDPTLAGQGAEVRYVLDGYGFISDVYIVLGKRGGADQLPAHAATARQLFKFTGVLGKARTLLDWARAFFARDPSLKVGKARAWEARIELEKLPRQVTDYMRGVGKGLAEGTLAPADVDAYVRGLYDQMAEHEARLRDASAPRRRIAAEDRSARPRTAREQALAEGRARALVILGVEPGALTVRDAPAGQTQLRVARDPEGRVEITVPARAPDGSPVTLADLEHAVRLHAELAARRPKEIVGAAPGVWDGAHEARLRGMPDAEPGFRWEIAPDGTLRHVPVPDPALARTRLEAWRRIDPVTEPDAHARAMAEDRAFQQRRQENEARMGQDEQVTQDLGAAGLDRQRLGWARTGDPARGGQRLPLCFQSWEQFAQFQREFAELIAGTLVDGRPITARAELIGSAATFYSGNPKKPSGHHFDKKGAGTADIDIWLTSPELALKVAEHPHAAPNVEATLGAERSIFRNKHRGGGFWDQFPAFKAFAARWGAILGREPPDIKLRLSDSLEASSNRSQTIVFAETKK